MACCLALAGMAVLIAGELLFSLLGRGRFVLAGSFLANFHALLVVLTPWMHRLPRIAGAAVIRQMAINKNFV